MTRIYPGYSDTFDIYHVYLILGTLYPMKFLTCCEKNQYACTDPEGDRGSGPLLKNHKNIGFYSTTCPDPLENHKATKTAFIVGLSSAR